MEGPDGKESEFRHWSESGLISTPPRGDSWAFFRP